jgi:hypothetical protein
VDAGGGWLIFALPPAELAVHPASEGGRAQLYLLCDYVAATVTALQAEGTEIAQPISNQGWGLVTAIMLPGGVELGHYEPRHPTAVQLAERHRLRASGCWEPGLKVQNADPVGANGDAGHWLSMQLRYPGLSLLLAKVAGGCGCVLRADVVQQLEQLGFLHIRSSSRSTRIQQRHQVRHAKPGPGLQHDRMTIS